MRVALIGFGSIARDVVAALASTGSNVDIAGVLVRPKQAPNATIRLTFVHSVEELIALQPRLVVECAGQQAVRQYGEAVLAAGVSLMPVSVGALCDDDLRQRLHDAAQENGCQIHLPAGAVGGIDALGAARIAGIEEVVYRAVKPAAAWKGSAADAQFDLDSLTDATVIFEGSARDAARLFPKNSNVAATIAIAGIGLDETRCVLVADPATRENTHSISVRSRAGSFSIDLAGKPSPTNPRTSMLTALSVTRALANLDQTIVI